jgi:hypothetical protein
MNTVIEARAVSNEGLTKTTATKFNILTSILCVASAGRGAVSSEATRAFFGRERAGGLDALKTKHPAFAGRRAGGFSTSGGTKKKGVFGVGALLPQFLAELTSTLNSQIWNYHSISARPWQA